MTIRNLNCLFKPSSVSVIGASPNTGTMGSVVVNNLRADGFSGAIYLVNPKRATIEGRSVHPDLTALPEIPDLAVIATPPSIALSADAIHFRFFGLIRELSHTMAARLTQIDYEREMALVLTERKPAGLADVFAVVRLLADPDGARAEFATVVLDDLVGKGLGRLLMRRIIDYAAGRDIGEIFGDVLRANARMLDLARHLGLSIEPVDQDSGIVRVSLRLTSSN